MVIQLKVSSKSSPTSVAGALASTVRKEEEVYIQVIGAGALNQAIKAIAIARGFLAPNGIDLVCKPSFVDVQVDTIQKTAIKLLIEAH